MTRHARARTLLIALTLLGGVVLPASGQHATPWLPAGHWSGSLLARLHALGAASHDPIASARPAAEAAAALPEPFLAWLRAETGVNGDAVAGARPLHIQLGAELVARREVLGPGGFTLDREWTGPVREPAVTGSGARAWLAAAPRRWLALTVAGVARTDDAGLEHATADVAAGRFHLWAGRRALGHAPGVGGGLVLNELARFDGMGARLATPWQLPLAGALTAELFAGALDRNGHVEQPWLAGMRVHARPHPRLDLGVTRVAMFGGMRGARLGVRQLVEVLVGANLDGAYADNQVASLDARWRPPHAALPLELYGEWGAHDADPGVFVDVPAFVVERRDTLLHPRGSRGRAVRSDRAARLVLVVRGEDRRAAAFLGCDVAAAAAGRFAHDLLRCRIGIGRCAATHEQAAHDS